MLIQRNGQEREIINYDFCGAQTPVMSGRPVIQRSHNEEDTRFGQQSLHRVQKEVTVQKWRRGTRCPQDIEARWREIAVWPWLVPREVPDAQG